MPLRDVLIALVVVSIWGFNFTVIKLSVAELPPLFAAALRFFFAAVPVIFFVARPKAPWRLVMGYGLAMGCALYALLNMAIYLGMPASLASLVLQIQAMLTMGLAFFFLGEVPRKLQLVGAGVAFSGIGIIALGHGVGVEMIPLLVTLLAAVAWAIANIVSKRAGAIPMIPFTVWGNFFASLPLFALAFAFEGGAALVGYVSPPSVNAIVLIAFLAYPATLFGFSMWSGLLSRHSAATVAPFTLLVPIAGITSGVLILGEPVYTIDIIGGVFIMAGLALTVFKIKPKQTPVQPGV